MSTYILNWDAYRLFAESWIEVASQPSSSSLSSAAEEIVTTGLRVQHDSNTRRRRRLRHNSPLHIQIGPRAQSTGGSSQEEYEESESESDRVMTSSNEGLQPSPLQELHRTSRALSNASSGNYTDDEGGNDDDENSTAIGIPPTAEQCFTPQPNAFSHPPSSHANRAPQSAGYFPPVRPTPRPPAHRHSYTAPQQQHTPYTVIAPSHAADHDAALRASLSTLLSLGAAARGLTKSDQPPAPAQSGPARLDPTSIRMVPESVALGGPGPSPPSSTHAQPASSRPRSPGAEKGKRKDSTGRSSSKERRAVKKARRTSASPAPMTEEISPTLLTWVVSAGVVVLVSALSFSAGYVVGREAGRAEAEFIGPLSEAASEARRCGVGFGSEIGRAGLGVRKLRVPTAVRV
ncbi:hypothetical protein H2201_000633 [Coniosporium apollinis]|uniref:Uncharacterized protein n=1 Tax=Coniosporium apollinis TaxID=61459 RepID=A0ABQ9P5M3_9PEZI|nr:hypothetical protein H2201_000633 [Coniosporium apollinis]